MNVFNKQPSEKLSLSMDFTNSLVSETIFSYTAKAYCDEEEVTATVISTSSNTTTKVSVTVFAGTTGKDYKITIVVTTTAGNIYEEDITMKVREV